MVSLTLYSSIPTIYLFNLGLRFSFHPCPGRFNSTMSLIVHCGQRDMKLFGDVLVGLYNPRVSNEMFSFHRDYERCDQEGEEEGRMEGESSRVVGYFHVFSTVFVKIITSFPSPGSDRGPAEHEDVVLLLQDDRHHDRGHHQ